MKTRWNMRSPVHTHTVIACCFLVFLAVLPAEAFGSGMMLMQEAKIDENGRTAEDRSRRGAPAPEARPTPPEEWKGCDFDDCSQGRQAVPESESTTVTGEQGAAATYSLGNLRSLQIKTGAPVNSVYVGGDGNIGIGTEAPRGRLHVVAKPGERDAADIFLLDATGNLEIGGLLTEASSVLLKENFEAVDGAAVLRRLAQLPITTWNYKTDAASVRHMGPTAQDFYGAFGLGADDRHIAPLDANGVALAAAQALAQQVQDQAAQITRLEAQNARLMQRLEALEALVNGRDQ